MGRYWCWVFWEYEVDIVRCDGNWNTWNFAFRTGVEAGLKAEGWRLKACPSLVMNCHIGRRIHVVTFKWLVSKSDLLGVGGASRVLGAFRGNWEARR